MESKRTNIPSVLFLSLGSLLLAFALLTGIVMYAEANHYGWRTALSATAWGMIPSWVLTPASLVLGLLSIIASSKCRKDENNETA